MIVSILLFFLVNFSAYARDYNYPSDYIVAGEFYPTMGPSFFSFKRPLDKKIFRGLPEKRYSISDTEVRKIKLTDLDLGIKDGDTAYFVDLYHETIQKYVFNEYANVLIYAHPEEDYSWGRYNVLLTNDPKKIEVIKKVVPSPYRSGFVYIGKDLDFSKAEFVKVPLEKVKSRNQVPKDFLKSGKFDHLRISNYFKDTLVFDSSTPYFWNPKKDEVVSGAPRAFIIPSDLSHLSFVKLDNGIMLLPLGDEQR
ncbi:MAG: hypothetical protein WDA09_06425, partial [Bacteriovoracaceae bacterium]